MKTAIPRRQSVVTGTRPDIVWAQGRHSDTHGSSEEEKGA